MQVNQIVFVDSKISNRNFLLNGVIPGIEVVTLERNRSGIAQITEALKQQAYSTVHIVAHGSPGCLYLGNTQLSLDTLDKYAKELKTWFNPPAYGTPLVKGFNPPACGTPLVKGGRGDLLIYGCNVAAGDAGEEFINKLHDLTDAEIAASSTLIGNADLGGNWKLDVATSSDTPQLAFSADVRQNYTGVFADIFVDDFDGSPTGWVVNPTGNDTAVTNAAGQWTIAPITEDRWNGNNAIALQLDPNSPPNALITGFSENDDQFTEVNGITTIHSPNFRLPTNGDLNSMSLSLQYYVVADGRTNAADDVRIDLINVSDGTVTNLFDPALSGQFPTSWSSLNAPIDSSLAGEEVYLSITANDPDNGSFLEFGIDDVSVTYDVPDGIFGSVFLDEDLNGTNEERIGVENITVTAYDASGAAVATAQTAADGTYILAGVDDTTEYRIEFTDLPPGYFETVGTGSSGSVSFATAGDEVNLGVHTSEFQPIDDALVRNYGLLVSCGVDDTNDYVLALTNAPSLAYSATTYDESSGLEKFHHEDWTLDRIGNIYFTEFDTDGNIFAPASRFTQTNYTVGNINNPGLQQYGSIGGSSAIYKMDAVTGEPVVWANLPQAGNGNSDAGMGGITYDDSTDSMYVVNMHDRTIYRITGSDDASGTVEDAFTPVLGTSTHSTGATFQNTPFGLDVYDGRLYYTVHDATGTGSLVVRSVGLNTDGSIDIADDREEINEVMPYTFPDDNRQGYPVVADIDFSPTGQMAIGTFTTGLAVDFGNEVNNYYQDANQSRLYNHTAFNYVYESGDTSWNRTAVTSVGQVPFSVTSTNGTATGGVAWGRESDGLETLWMSGGDFAGEDSLWGAIGYDSTQLDNSFNQEDASDYIQFLFPGQDSVDPKGNGGDVDVFAFDPIEIGNRIWNDADGDGTQDPGEAGIEGVTINLFNAAGDVLLGTTTTNADGEYYFNDSNVNQNGANGLEPNTDYQIQIDVNSPNLNGLSLTQSNSNDNDSIDSDAVDSNGTPTISVTTGGYGENNYTLDAGFGLFYSLSGTVYEDTNLPADNTIEGSDTPIGGVTINLYDANDLDTIIATTTTDADTGFYEFSSLSNGNYVVRQEQPGDYDSVTESDNVPDNEIAVTINGADETGNDFLEEKVVSIGSTVFRDNNNDGIYNGADTGIADVEVQLYNPGADGQIGNGDDVLVSSSRTNGSGNYIFRDLPEGDYYVSIPDTNFNAGEALAGTPLSSEVTDNADNTEDNDDNGIQATVGAVTNSPVINLTANEEPNNEIETRPGRGQDNGVNETDGDMTVDFGFTSVYSLSGTVYNDTNEPTADSIEAADTPLGGVTMTLYSDSDNDGVADTGLEGDRIILDTTITDGNGFYEFNNLTNGGYLVEQTQPDNYDSVTDADGVDDNQIAIAINGADETGNGFLEEQVVSIGSTVFEDVNNNGIQDDGESSIPGVSLELYSVGADGVIGTSDDALVSSRTTNNDGNYIFNNLLQGNYYVFIPETNFAAGNALENTLLSSVNTDTADNGEDGDDNGIQDSIGGVTTSPVINLTVGDEPTNADSETALGQNIDDSADANGDMTVDFGFTSVYSVSGTVYNDTNEPTADGIEATDTPIEGVSMTLYADSDGNGVADTNEEGDRIILDTTTTDGNGFYEFSQLLNGSYLIEQTQPDNYDSVTDADGVDDNQIAIAINGADETGNDFLEQQIVSLGSTVFADVNNSGILDDGEAGIEGVTVQLFDSSGTQIPVGADGILGTADDGLGGVVTNSDGNYFFDDLTPGDYRVVIPESNFDAGNALENTPFSSADVDTLDNGEDNDSNGIQASGRGSEVTSPVINLDSGTETGEEFGSGGTNDDLRENNGDMTVDFGFVTVAEFLDIDYGDAPDSLSATLSASNNLSQNGNEIADYRTRAEDDGAAHIIDPDLRLGSSIDAESGEFHNAQANADDFNDLSDEDGVSFPEPMNSYNISEYSVDVDVTNNSDRDATLVGWIDFDSDGLFEANEAVSQTIAAGSGQQTVTLEWIELSGVAGPFTYGRFRISSDPSFTTIDDSTSYGLVSDGEVEDYFVCIAD